MDAGEAYWCFMGFLAGAAFHSFLVMWLAGGVCGWK
jgi:hypothetical protein